MYIYIHTHTRTHTNRNAHSLMHVHENIHAYLFCVLHNEYTILLKHLAWEHEICCGKRPVCVCMCVCMYVYAQASCLGA